MAYSLKVQETVFSVPCLVGTHPKLQSGPHGPLSTRLRSLDKITGSPEVFKKQK